MKDTDKIEIRLKIPHSSIESAQIIAEQVNRHLEEKLDADLDDWGDLYPKDVLERVLDGSSERTYVTDFGNPCRVEYHDLENNPEKVFNLFVCEYKENQ